MAREETPSKPVFETSVHYLLGEPASESGEGQLRLDSEAIILSPLMGTPIRVSLRDVLDVSRGDYSLAIRLPSGGPLVLTQLGYRYEDCLRELAARRGELLLGDLLMDEKLVEGGFRGEAARTSSGGASEELGPSELRLYETGLVVLPPNGEPVRLRYATVLEVRPEEYALRIGTSEGESWTFSKMGPRQAAFQRALGGAMAALVQRDEALLKDMAPHADPLVIRRAARLVADGRAASQADVEAVSPDLWRELAARVSACDDFGCYAHLKELARPGRLRLGFKRGLMGEVTGEVIWILAPLFSSDPSAPGNAVALEAVAGDVAGKATYFFKLMDRRRYAGGLSLPQIETEAERAMDALADALAAVNFRREPLYLSEQALLRPEYRRYGFAVERIAALRSARSAFVGRVLHRDPEQWKRDVETILRFNVTRDDETARWSASTPDD